jgi:hypothetical protein
MSDASSPSMRVTRPSVRSTGLFSTVLVQALPAARANMARAVIAVQIMPAGLCRGWNPTASTMVDCTARYRPSAANAALISRSARRWRCSLVPDSSQMTTVDAPISISESRPKPASTTGRAAHAAAARTMMLTTFHPRVAYSGRNPGAATFGSAPAQRSS